MTPAASRLHQVRARVAAAAKAARRNPASVEIVGVSKGRSRPEIEEIIATGLRDFGENRVQEAQEKWPEILASHPDIRLHFVGRLQSNKAADAVALFDVIHSLDRPSLVEALGEASVKAGKRPAVYIQVNIGDEGQKGGCPIADLPGLVDLARSADLDLVGLMAIPPADQQPGSYFALLAKLAARHGLNGLSMGMSSDIEPAVMLGATAVRVGSALFEDQ